MKKTPKYLCKVQYNWQPLDYYKTGWGLHKLKNEVELVIPLDLSDEDLIHIISKKIKLNEVYVIFNPVIINKRLSGSPSDSKAMVERFVKLLPSKGF